MSLLHFQPISGKAVSIINAILQTEEVASVSRLLTTLYVVAEEIVVNVIDYSHSDYLDVEVLRDSQSITMRFRDGGLPFNPLKKDLPDITLPMEQRSIGGLGIFLVIAKMDTVNYEHTNGENILTVTKTIEEE